ncbi:MAG: NYN domain-containing protein [Candidatus ainarchaeum sp.]|nr:NYN domain-containing protein [Candidatus ainarchaeum sp.]
MKRTHIFIDGSNLYHNLKKIGLQNISFRELIKLLNNDSSTKIFYYNASLDISFNQEKYWNQQKFFDSLKKIPNFNLVLCKLRKHKRKNGFIFDIKGDDVNLAIDLVSEAYEDNYDTATIVSGDEDFVPAIKKVQKLGKTVINAYFKSSSSASLKKICDNSIYLNKELEKIITARHCHKDHTGENIINL